MELLLILSALLTGLTGAFTGDRLQPCPAVQSAGVEAAASAEAVALAETAATLLQERVTATWVAGDQAVLSWARNPSSVRSIVGISERRLE